MSEATSKLNILVKVQDEASSALRRLSNDISDLGGSLNFSGMKAGVLAGALMAVAGAAMMQSIKSYSEAEDKMAKFDTIINNLPPKLRVYREQILAVANSATKLGFDNEEAAVSIAQLLQTTGNAQLAFKAFQAAMDLARYKGISLEDATRMLILAFQGQGRILKELNIDVDDHATKETILANVLGRVGGAAENHAKKLAGLNDILKQYKQEVMEAIGQPFAEVIKMIENALIGWVEKQGGINALLEKHEILIKIISGLLMGVFLGGVAAAVAAVLGALGPFGLIIAALFAIGSVITLLITLWHNFGDIIVKFVQFIVEKIKELISSIRQELAAEVNWIQTHIIDWFVEKIKWIESAIARIRALISSAWSAASGVVNSAVGGAARVLGSRQTGGYIPETGPYLLHAGEYVIPARYAGAGTGGVINVYLQGDFYTDTEIAKRFGDLLAKEIKYQLKL